MSVTAIVAAFRYSTSKGAARLVLLAMADEANSSGELTAYRRSQSWLARKANIDARTTRRAIGQLVELGEIEILNPGDGRTSTDYRLRLPGLDDDEGGHPAPPRGTSGPATEGDTPPQGGHHAPPIIPSSPDDTPVDPEPLLRETDALDAGFDRFWTVYPNRAAKGTARKAWPAAVKAARGIGPIVAGAEKYRDDPNRDPSFTAHASTWLRGERWNDPPLPVRGNGRPAPATRRIMDDRDGPEGRIDL